MTTRLKNIMQTVCIVLILMLVPGTARPQEQKEPSAPQPAAATQGNAPASTGDAAAAARVPAAEEPAHPYIIKQGDTLWDIANTFFKDPFLWPFLWKANPAITNPDLIFAGNKLIIPVLAPIERALQAEAPPKEPSGEKQEPAKTAAAVVEEPVVSKETSREGLAGASVTSPKPLQPIPAGTEEEKLTGGSTFIMPEEQIFPIVDKYAMLSAGFVSADETKDTITGTQEKGKTLLGYDDVVYVSMRDAENIKVGDKYLIFNPLNKVKHPKTGKYFGRLIKGLGILQITAKDPAANVLTARITISFDEIEKGSMVTPYQEPTPIYQSAQKKAKNLSGYILEVTDRRTINSQSDVVYLDLGKVDGVEPGDHFSVYEEPSKKGFPRKVIGDVQVLLVKEHTATAVVKTSTEPISKGSAVDFKP
jgi:LysM repeat protein